MTDLSRQDVQQILDLIEKSTFDFFELQSGELKLTVSKSALASAAPQVAAPGARSAPVAPTPPPLAAAPATAAPAATAAPVSAPAKSGRSADIARVEGLVIVQAPMIGTFYAQSEPGAPPYVQTGSHVEPETTMGLIEIMKVFNAVHPPVSGSVEEILVKNTDFVEFGEALFLIRPDAAGSA